MHAIIDTSNVLCVAKRDPARFAVGCEGEVIDTFSTAAAALIAARSWSEFTATPHQIYDAATHTVLCIVEPSEAA